MAKRKNPKDKKAKASVSIDADVGGSNVILGDHNVMRHLA
jgi:hypothetical protein